MDKNYKKKTEKQTNKNIIDYLIKKILVVYLLLDVSTTKDFCIECLNDVRIF